MKDCPDISPPVVIFLAVLVGLCGWFSYGVTKRLINVTSQSRRIVTLESDPYYLETYIGRHRSSLTLLGGNVSFARLLTTEKNDAQYDSALEAANEELLVSVKVYPHMEKISIANKLGVVIASSLDSDVGLRRTDATARVEELEKTGTFDICSFVSNEDRSVAVLVPVRVGREPVGVVIGQICLDDSFEFE